MAERRFIRKPDLAPLWASSLTSEQIGEKMGFSANAVIRAAKRFGLKPRGPGWRPSTATKEMEAESCRAPLRIEDDKKAARIDRAPDHPFFTPHHDARIIEADGRYANLTALADEWGQPITRVQQRSHVLRAV